MQAVEADRGGDVPINKSQPPASGHAIGAIDVRSGNLLMMPSHGG